MTIRHYARRGKIATWGEIEGTLSDQTDLQAALDAVSEVNDLSSSVTWATVPDGFVSESSVTQHQAALSITESQISDLGAYLTEVVASDVNSESAADGYVLTSDGAGGAAWEASAGSGPTLISGSTVSSMLRWTGSQWDESTNVLLGGTLETNVLLEAHDDITLDGGLGINWDTTELLTYTPPADSFYADATHLSLFAGTDGDTAYTSDIGDDVWTFNGTTRIESDQYETSPTSLYIGGGSSGSNYIEAASNANFLPDSSDFTIEWHARPGNVSRTEYLGGVAESGGNNRSWLISTSLSGRLNASLWFDDGSGTMSLAAGVGAQSLNTWKHYCLMRSGTGVYFFVDGVLKDSDVGTISAGANMRGQTTVTAAMRLGLSTGNTNCYTGYIDNFRFTLAARYDTSGFTPPASGEGYSSESSKFVAGDGDTATQIDGSSINLTAAATLDSTLNVTGAAELASTLDVAGAATFDSSLTIFDSTGVDYAAFSHDGTDFNTAFSSTVDWNWTGLPILRALSTDIIAEGLYVEDQSGETVVELRKYAAGSQASVNFKQETGVLKWKVGVGATTDDNFLIARYNDSGVYQDLPFAIDSASGHTKVDAQFSAGGNGSDNFTISTFDQGLAIADRTTNNDPYIAFWEDTTYSTRNGFLQVADSGTFLRSEVNGARVNISAKDAGGTVREILNGDPDDNTDLNGDTGIRLQIGGTTVAGFTSTINYVALPFYLKERAAAASDIATYGQLWVKNTTPCQLWFTDDAGTDTQIV